jgi:hypothetical protein
MLEFLYDLFKIFNNSPWPFVIGMSIFCIMLFNVIKISYGFTIFKLFLIFSLFLLFNYIFITYFCNLIICENMKVPEYITKDYNDCECFKSFKHGKVPVPIIYEQLVFIEIYFKTFPYLSYFYNKVIMFECSCQCYYCLYYKDTILIIFFLIIFMSIIFNEYGKASSNPPY